MDWEQHFCPDPACAADCWQARQAAENPELWQLVDRFGGAYTVAAVAPVCPRCGTTLHPGVARAQPAGAILEAEQMQLAARTVKHY